MRCAWAWCSGESEWRWRSATSFSSIACSAARWSNKRAADTCKAICNFEFISLKVNPPFPLYCSSVQSEDIFTIKPPDADIRVPYGHDENQLPTSACLKAKDHFQPCSLFMAG